jgi:hypothetical protein
MKYLILLISILIISCSENKIETLYLLEGSWQIEGKQQFEKWEKFDGSLQGAGYKLIKEEKQIFEKLSIKVIKGKVVYQATVINQNEGKTISFPLNEMITEYYSFENFEHDFPKKIQYFKLSENKIKVKVLGDNDQGFSFVMNRLPN